MDVINQGVLKKFKGPCLSLPPIQETSVPFPPESASSPSTQSTTSSLQFQTRRPTRRASIASFSSVRAEITLHEIKTKLRRESLKSNDLSDRRDSLTRRFDLLQKKTAKNTIEPVVKAKRRQSVAAVMVSQTGRRASFRTIGSRVTNLLKVKNAFNRGMIRKPTVELEEDDIDKASEIKELPKEPRFASTLSVEAQYAMMKGYEDVVYTYLSKSYPEYRPLLRRSRTPLTGVKVKVPDVILEAPPMTGDDSDDESSKADTNDSPPKSPRATKSPSDRGNVGGNSPSGNDNGDGIWPTGKENVDGQQNVLEPVKDTRSPSESPDEKTTKSSDSPEYSPRNRGYNRIPTPPCYRSLPSSVASQRNHENLANIARYNSLPNLVSKDKQLVMTYRYESAMDILDKIKKSIGLHATSPRLTKGVSLEPVRDFNLWSQVWNKEFEPENAAKTTCA